MQPYQEFNHALQLFRLPSEVIASLNDYLWGTTQDWKRKLNIIHTLPKSTWYVLKDVAHYRSYSNLMESEDCFYCTTCGEKTLHFTLSFYSERCDVCQMRT